jgi:hypothetical protein
MSSNVVVLVMVTIPSCQCQFAHASGLLGRL